jgi:hypothetical protein
MKKLILGILLMMSATTSYGKCNLSNYTLYFSHQFTASCKLWDSCQNCATTLSYSLKVQNYSKYCFSENKQSCGYYMYEMCKLSPVDTNCQYRYFYTIWNGPFFDKLSKGQWDTTSAFELAKLYKFPQEDKIKNIEGRVMYYQYPRNGRYLLINRVSNCNSDTVTFSKITIDCMAGIEDIRIPETKLIGTFDMLGRPVEKVEDNIPYIFLYENGQRKKIIRNK